MEFIIHYVTEAAVAFPLLLDIIAVMWGTKKKAFNWTFCLVEMFPKIVFSFLKFVGIVHFIAERCSPRLVSFDFFRSEIPNSSSAVESDDWGVELKCCLLRSALVHIGHHVRGRSIWAAARNNSELLADGIVFPCPVFYVGAPVKDYALYIDKKLFLILLESYRKEVQSLSFP